MLNKCSKEHVYHQFMEANSLWGRGQTRRQRGNHHVSACSTDAKKKIKLKKRTSTTNQCKSHMLQSSFHEWPLFTTVPSKSFQLPPKICPCYFNRNYLQRLTALWIVALWRSYLPLSVINMTGDPFVTQEKSILPNYSNKISLLPDEKYKFFFIFI